MIKNKIYTEVDLHGPSSYILEDEGQKYPVVPFAVLMTCLCKQGVWIKVYLDGQQICSRPLLNTFTCDCVKSGWSLNELLFSIPRIVEDQDKPNPLGEYAGTLKVTVYETRVTGTRNIPLYNKKDLFHNSSKQGLGPNVLRHLSKKDVQYSQQLGEMGAVVSREGRTRMELQKTGRYRVGYNYETTSTVLEEIVIHIRPIISNIVAPVLEQNPKCVETSLEKECKPVRKPLGDVINSVRQQTTNVGSVRNSNKASYAPEQTNGNISEQAWSGGDGICSDYGEVQIKRRESCRMGALFEPKTAEAEMAGVGHAISSGLQMGNISEGISSEYVHRPLGAVEIKRRESCRLGAFSESEVAVGNRQGEEAGFRDTTSRSSLQTSTGLIPPERIKTRRSTIFQLGGAQPVAEACLIPPDQIKKRQSLLIPADMIKRRESAVLPPASSIIKQRIQIGEESFLVVDSDPSDNGEIKREDESFIIIDESDDEESIIYLYDEADNSVVCVGDDDCCVLDISQSLSMVELNSSNDDMSMELSLDVDEDELLGL